MAYAIPLIAGTEFRPRNLVTKLLLVRLASFDYTRAMDEFIAQVAADHRIAARQSLAWTVEQNVQRLGLMSYFVDAEGDGPFIQAIKETSRAYRM